jgi:hypothetical protein
MSDPFHNRAPRVPSGRAKDALSAQNNLPGKSQIFRASSWEKMRGGK